MVEFALIFPIFLLFVFGGLEIFLWQMYTASAQFLAQEGAQVPGAATASQTVADAQSEVDLAVNKSFLMGTPYSNCTMPAGGPMCTPGVFMNTYDHVYIFAQDTGGNLVITIHAWKPSPTPILIGNSFPIFAQNEQTQQSFTP